jgi:hypothetical protein
MIMFQALKNTSMRLSEADFPCNPRVQYPQKQMLLEIILIYSAVLHFGFRVQAAGIADRGIAFS